MSELDPKSLAILHVGDDYLTITTDTGAEFMCRFPDDETKAYANKMVIAMNSYAAMAAQRDMALGLYERKTREHGQMMDTNTKGNERLVLLEETIRTLIKASEQQHMAMDWMFAKLIEASPRDNTFFPSKSGQPWEALVNAKAERERAAGMV